MAEKNIVGGIFGLTPELYQQGLMRQSSKDNLAAAQLTPGQLSGFYAMEAGTGLGRATQGLLGVEDPQLNLIRQTNQLVQEIGVDSPKKLKMLASELQKLPGGAPLAAQAIDQANKMLESAATVTAKTREQLPSVAKLQLYRDRLIEAGASPEQIAEVNAVIKAEGEGKGTKINLGVSTVDKEAGLREGFLKEVKPFRDPYIAASKLESLLTSESSLADRISKKQWAKLAGDATISNKDTDAITNYGDLGTRLVGIINQFAEGKYSEEQRREAVNLARQIKSQSQTQYKDIQGDYVKRAQDAKLPENTIKFVAPELPVSSGVAFVVGRTYRDKSGKLGVFEGYDTEGKPKFKPAQ